IGFVQLRDQLGTPELGDAGGQLRHHFATAQDARRVVRIGRAPLIDTERLAEGHPVLVARRDVRILAVLAAEARRGYTAGMLGPEALRDLAEREVARRSEREQRDLAVEHREVDLAAAAGTASSSQRGEDRDRDPQPGGEIRHRQPGLYRRAAALA